MEGFSGAHGLFEAAILVAVLSGIPLGVSMFVGLTLSVLQAATQIQEQTLTFVPKLAAVGLALLISGNWMMRQLQEYCFALFESVQQISLM